MFALLEMADMLGPAAACMAAAAAEAAEAFVWLTRYSRVSVDILLICSGLAPGLQFFSVFVIWLIAGTTPLDKRCGWVGLVI